METLIPLMTEFQQCVVLKTWAILPFLNLILAFIIKLRPKLKQLSLKIKSYNFWTISIKMMIPPTTWVNLSPSQKPSIRSRMWPCSKAKGSSSLSTNCLLESKWGKESVGLIKIKEIISPSLWTSEKARCVNPTSLTKLTRRWGAKKRRNPGTSRVFSIPVGGFSRTMHGAMQKPAQNRVCIGDYPRKLALRPLWTRLPLK